MLKRNIIYITTTLLTLACVATLMFTPVVLAQCGGMGETNIVKCEGEGLAAAGNLLQQVVLILTGAVGILAVGAVVAGGILYSMSAGSPDKIQKAKTIWTNTVIGIAIYAFLVSITNFLIPGGVFG